MAREVVDLGDGWVVRGGVLCGCGPRHGRFARCVGSESPMAEAMGLAGKPSPARPAKRDRDSKHVYQTMWHVSNRTIRAKRKTITFTVADTDACPDCIMIHQAPKYCDAHRELAIQNVLTKVASDAAASRCGSLLLMVAERHGIDLTR